MKILALTTFIYLTALYMSLAQPQQPPRAAKKTKELNIHGQTRIDNYYWLNDRENPEVIDYLNAENAYTQQTLATTNGLQTKLFDEMKARIKEQDESLPYKENGYYYYSRFVKGGEYPIYCRKKGTLKAAEEVLFNGNEMAKGLSYHDLGGYEISDNNQIAAFGEDTVSRRMYTLRFKNLKTGQVYPEEIPNTEGGSYAWASDNKTLFYVLRNPKTLLGYQVWRHELNTEPTRDVLIYEEKDNQYYMGLYRTKSKKYIAIVSDHNGVATEYQLLNAQNPTGTFRSFCKRERGHEYQLQHFNDRFYVRTNWLSPNCRLMEVSEDQAFADWSAWKEVIAHRPNVFLEGMEVFKNHLVLSERKEGLLQIRVINFVDKSDHYINFGEPTYTAQVSYNPDFNAKLLRFGYTSFTTPNTVFDYNMDTRTKKLKKQQQVLGGFDAAQYTSERVYATARDGVQVPISIVYKKGTKLDGTAPLLQYSYGSYGYSSDATFSSNRLSLLNRGFVYTVCHIRGGQEMGRSWYEDGKMFKKKNTFTDFIDCAEFLVAKKYTSSAKLFAMGGSAGGLLMGAVANLRPDLYRGIVAAVPFVDVVTTMLDETIPLTTGEFEEWGNPKNKDSYEYMLSYSPYDQVAAKAYPNLLVTTGLNDSQVQYWEPAKWVAKLRDLKTDANQLLLHTNMDAGHGGASGRFTALKEVALEYAFMMNLVGLKE